MNNRNSLYVENTLVDLPPGFVFATTITRLALEDITARNVGYTNTVKLQWTPVNSKVFAFAWNEKISSTIPYRKLAAKMVQNGIEVIPDGLCWINAADDSGVTITIFENVLALFAYMEGRVINQLNYIAPSGWNAADIDTARLATSQVKALVMNWGKPGALYQVNFFLPSFFYSELITKILQSTGLTLNGAILTDTDFTDLMIPYGLGKWEYPPSLGESCQFNVSKQLTTQNVTAVPGGAATRVTMDADSPTPYYQGSARIFNLATDEAVVPDFGVGGAWLTVRLSGSIDISATSFGDPGGSVVVAIEIYDEAGGYQTGTSITYDDATYGPAPTIASVIAIPQLDYVMKTGWKIMMTIGQQSGATNGQYVLQSSSGTFITCQVLTAPNRSSVVWNQLMPDILQIDALKDFIVRFGIVFKQVGNTLYLKTLNEIIADTASAVNWTSKRVLTGAGDTIVFKADGYAQKNYFNYSQSAEVADERLGSGLISITNTILASARALFTSIFGNSYSPITGGGAKATIPVYDASSTNIDTFANQPGVRLVTQRARLASEGSITFNVTARSDYKVGYFTDATQAKDTSLDYFVKKRYVLMNSALQSAKTITRWYLLNELDIATFDQHKLIYDNGSYYLVNKIFNFIPGKPTKVELFKV